MAIFLTEACLARAVVENYVRHQKNYIVIGRSGRQLSCEPIQAVRVSCKPFSNNWFLSRLDVSRGLFSLVQSALALF